MATFYQLRENKSLRLWWDPMNFWPADALTGLVEID
jgi:hypothetical protein